MSTTKIDKLPLMGYDAFNPKYNTKLKRVGMETHVPLVVLKRNFLSYPSRR
jgi:hypothetical protein